MLFLTKKQQQKKWTYLRAAQTNALKCESAERFKGVWVVIMISMALRSD